MGLIKDFEEYLNSKKNTIDEINKVRLVTNPSQLTKYLNEHQKSNNLLAIGVIPNFGNNNPDSGDSFQLRAFTEIMLLKKTDYSDLPYKDFVTTFDDILEVAMAFKDSMLEDHLAANCNFLRKLNPQSIQIVEVYNLNQCNGWNIIFTFDL